MRRISATWFYCIQDRWWLTGWVSSCFLVVSGLLLPYVSKHWTRDSGCLGRVAGQPCCCRAEPSGTVWGCPWGQGSRNQHLFCTIRSELSSWSRQCKLLAICLCLVRMQQLPGGECVKSHDLKSVLLAAGVWSNELEVVGIITVDNLLCGNGLKASCFLSRS